MSIDKELARAFKELGQKIEDFDLKYDLFGLEEELKNISKTNELLEQHNLSGLVFYKDEYYSNYLCMTNEEASKLKYINTAHLKPTTSDLEILLNEVGWVNVKFTKTGKTYNSISDLKRDFITVKLSGV
jgi:hypothetical protein